MASEIAILNADHFMGATGFSHLHEKKSTGMQKDKTAPQRRPKENEDGPRKRARRSAAGSLPSKTPSVDVHENGEEESTKRTRGRPRLDTTGQTAADVGGFHLHIGSLIFSSNVFTTCHRALKLTSYSAAGPRSA